MADQEQLDKLGTAYISLRHLREQGQIEEDSYHKMVVSMAYEFMVLGDSVAAVGLLQGIPESYYQQVQTQQMREDPDYAKVARALAQKLVDEHVVDMGPEIRPTQAPAQA